MKTVSLKRVARFAYGGSLASEDRVPDGVDVYGSNGKIGTHNRSNTDGPVLVIGRKGSFGAINYSDSPVFAIDTTFYVDSSQTDADMRWLYYVLASASLGSTSQDTGVPGLSRELAYATPVFWVPRDRQQLIADFLDRETERIDALVDTKRRLIDLLAEKRTALITHAVTKGLDPTLPMKDSGIPWIGDIPAHWDSGPLRRWWSVVDCKHRTAEYVDGGIPIVGIADVQELRLDLSRAKGTTRSDYDDLVEGSRRPRRGDIIYSRNASLGQAAYVDTDQAFCMGQDLCLIRSDRQHQLFMTMQLRSQVVAAQLDTLMVGATFKRINVEQIRNYAVVRPPASDQVRIGLYLDNFATTMKSADALIQKQLHLLAEYRQAVITAAVTGQLDEGTLKGRKPADEVLSVEVPS